MTVGSIGRRSDALAQGHRRRPLSGRSSREDFLHARVVFTGTNPTPGILEWT